MKGGLFGIYQQPFCRKTQKNERVTLWWKKSFVKKVAECQEKLKGGPFSLDRYCMLHGKKTKTLLGSVPWSNRYILAPFFKFRRNFGRIIFWSHQVYRKKTLTKIHDSIRLFSQEKRRLKRKQNEHLSEGCKRFLFGKDFPIDL